MVRSRSGSPTKGEANLLPATLPELGRSLRLAREQADLTLPEAAAVAGVDLNELDALETGRVGQQHDRIGTLRALRAYANSLGLSGNDYVLVAVEQWPAPPLPLGHNGDTAVVPVVSISSAPPGGHSPAGGSSTWAADATGVSDAFTTGVIDQVRPAALHDTGRVPIVDTGEVRAVGMGAPRILKVLVGVVATLVVLGGVGLIEHARLNDWVHDGRTSTSRWYADVKSALGITSKSSSSGHTSSVTPPPKTSTSHPATDTTKITLTPNPDGQSVAIDVHASSFTVKILATPGDCWVQATVAGQPQPIFGQVLQANQSHVFTVTHSMTINTGSSSGRAYLYRGTKLIGFYFPTKAPFLMQFNPVG